MLPAGNDVPLGVSVTVSGASDRRSTGRQPGQLLFAVCRPVSSNLVRLDVPRYCRAVLRDIPVPKVIRLGPSPCASGG